jgi:hypothetical protein
VPAGTWTLIPGPKEGYLPLEDPARTLKDCDQVKDVALKLARPAK